MASSWAADNKHCIFSITTQLAKGFKKNSQLKIVSPTAIAKLAIDSASLESIVLNREIFIPNREIGRFSLFYQKIGRSPAKSGDLEALHPIVSDCTESNDNRHCMAAAPL